ncbi:MAG: CDP-2,3-bis-(O-geranylgeranyl)-sn-glycerol synthase [Desulfurococcales archaeon]|nr:CDP-2,3-bis-(O-geranylgeranyl)-sn-glycerol synthase [Desulfurococcales archaeon]
MDLGGALDLLILVLPAMVANGTPVALSRVTRRGIPIDMGRRMPDGRRILGDGKTVEGFIAGLAAAALTGIILYTILGDPRLVEASLASGLGAMLGDMAGSFLKRRLGLERGAPAPLLDQLDFYLGALVMLRLAGFSVEPLQAAIVGILVVVLHFTTNYIAYRLGLKNVPW